MVASMQAMNENNVISSFKIFIEADCSNLGGDAKNWAKSLEDSSCAHGVRHGHYDYELYGLRALLKVKSEESAESFGTFG